jgi:hypothetical protein
VLATLGIVVQKLFLLIALSYLSLSVSASEYQLNDTAAFFTPPSTIVFQTGTICSSPCLNFNLPKGPHGGAPGFPDFSIDKISKNFSEYLKEIKSYETGYKILYRDNKIKGYSVAEIAYTREVIFHFVGGGSGSGSRPAETREIVFDFKEYIISCSLTSHSKDYEVHLATLIELCNSINVKPE